LSEQYAQEIRKDQKLEFFLRIRKHWISLPVTTVYICIKHLLYISLISTHASVTLFCIYFGQ